MIREFSFAHFTGSTAHDAVGALHQTISTDGLALVRDGLDLTLWHEVRDAWEGVQDSEEYSARVKNYERAGRLISDPDAAGGRRIGLGLYPDDFDGGKLVSPNHPAHLVPGFTDLFWQLHSLNRILTGALYVHPDYVASTQQDPSFFESSRRSYNNRAFLLRHSPCPQDLESPFRLREHSDSGTEVVWLLPPDQPGYQIRRGAEILDVAFHDGILIQAGAYYPAWFLDEQNQRRERGLPHLVAAYPNAPTRKSGAFGA